jgi:multidrug efflux pump subunit AcrB
VAKQADGPTVIVIASYPGESARVVAETVAAPIEQQVNGAPGMVRIESESHNNGGYVARVQFEPKTDAKHAVKLVRNRVSLAEPVLPDAVKRAEISVKIGAPAKNSEPVVIALQDQADLGHELLRQWSEKVVERLVTDGAAIKPGVFPGPNERHKTKSPFKRVVADLEVTRPAAVYRVNLYPSMRISGFPPKNKSAAEAAANWVHLAELCARKGFEVENLTAK